MPPADVGVAREAASHGQEVVGLKERESGHFPAPRVWALSLWHCSSAVTSFWGSTSWRAPAPAGSGDTVFSPCYSRSGTDCYTFLGDLPS